MSRPGSVSRSFSAATASPAPTRSAYQAPAPSAAPGSNSPSLAYRQHHDVTAPQIDTTAFRQSWRLVTRLDGLLEAGRIDRETWNYAAEWRRWFETVTPYRHQSWDVRVQVSCVPNDGGMLRRIAAAGQLREAAAALGELRIRLLEACVVHDRAWREIAALLRVTDKTATTRVVEALEALADWRAGRPVAPPPAPQYRRNGAGAS
jgi:DNA-directed RNA polymerase specialized sigma24 family protein